MRCDGHTTAMPNAAEGPPRVADETSRPAPAADDPTAAGVPDDDIAATLRRAASALQRAGIPFMLGGSLACWARGGPGTRNDVDLLVTPASVDSASAALHEAGMRLEAVPEDWLRKAWDGEVMVDLITSTLGNGEVTDEAIARADRMSVLAMSMPVASLESVLVSKLMAISEQRLDFAGPLAIARAVREQVDWPHVYGRVRESPYARAFFKLLDELEIVRLEEIRGS